MKLMVCLKVSYAFLSERKTNKSRIKVKRLCIENISDTAFYVDFLAIFECDCDLVIIDVDSADKLEGIGFIVDLEFSLLT